jgi:hypothetical protein
MIEMPPKQGWYAGHIHKPNMYVPTLWTIHCVTQLDYPFETEEECLKFIKEEVIGQGLRDE